MSRSVLFVASDASFHSLMAPLLERRGCLLAQARDAEDARAAIARRPPHVIILDERLPDIAPLEWIQALRGEEVISPVILVAGSSEVPRLQQAVRALSDVTVVPRPILPSVFVGLFERLAGPDDDVVGSEVDAELSALRRDYAARLPMMVRELAVAASACRAVPLDPAACDRAIGLAHTLRGTLGTYGFGEIGDAVARVEDALHRLLRSPAQPSEWGDIERWLDDARERARDARARTSSSFTAATRVARSPLARILLVSASEDVVRATVEAGQSQRVEVLTVSDAGAALAFAADVSPDAVLAVFPAAEVEEEGARFAEALRTLSGNEVVPVGFFGPADGAPARVVRVEGAANVFFPTPTDAGGYRAALRQLVALRQAERAHVLVLDDDPSFTAYMAAVLGHAGMLVTQMHHPGSLMLMLEETQPDLLLLDVRMPGVTGFELCQVLRASPRWKDLPILFITASRDVESRVAAFHAGADDYLDKPIVAEELLARVKVRVERARLLRRVREERARADELLLNVLPKAIAVRLKRRAGPIADRYAAATVLFADLANFTSLSARTEPERMVALLNEVFTRFDQLADKHGLEKIKTIGDAYMVAGGVPVPRPDHAIAVAEMALGMMKALEGYEVAPGVPLELRIGISSGPVVAGVIGERKFIFDVWGDTVNTASRMESEGQVGCIQVSTPTCRLLREHFLLERRGRVEVKGKGKLTTWFLRGRKA